MHVYSRLLKCFLFSSAIVAMQAGMAQDRYPDLPNETPAHFTPVDNSFDYTRRVVDIPMRDGVKLHTVIVMAKGTAHAGILMTRTPYNADGMTERKNSPHIGPVLDGFDTPADIIEKDGYIRVVQDIRGKYGSGGDYIMNRPLRGPQNRTAVDESTDIYDTVDWLVKHVPESNGKVGIIGISYDGFEALMATVHPHPAMKVAVPINPMVDGWMGDDWFHNGAFRQQGLPYIYGQAATRSSTANWWSGDRDDYDLYLKAGSAGALGKSRGMEQIGFWRKLLAHPAYDAFWQEQAVDKQLAALPLTVPTMLVHSLWDQEDIYGAMAAYRALAPKDPDHQKLFLVIGPWRHAKSWEAAATMGAIPLGSDTGTYFRENILRPFLAQYLKDDAPTAGVAPVNAYVSGVNRWETHDAWPPTIANKPLYLHAGGGLGFAPGDNGYDEYVSDPAKPVPYRIRPIQPWIHGIPDQVESWPEWLADDQREFATRTDVLTYVSDVLTSPLRISGEPAVNLMASTSGSDCDWVVKLIDVYPDEVHEKPSLGGYELGIAMDIFRSRYREGFAEAKPIAAGQPLPYRFPLPTSNHVFAAGHRVMVQIQSSWFPLYDRNPQTFVKNIFLAEPGDYRKAIQRIYHTSFIELPVVEH
jgi:putative CocE/NonD family hydrolase